MKLTKKGYFIFIAFLVGCTDSYRDLGLYSSRVDAQNNALADILKNEITCCIIPTLFRIDCTVEDFEIDRLSA